MPGRGDGVLWVALDAIDATSRVGHRPELEYIRHATRRDKTPPIRHRRDMELESTIMDN